MNGDIDPKKYPLYERDQRINEPPASTEYKPIPTAQDLARKVLEHRTDGEPCWCNPTIETHEERNLVIHNDFRN